MNFSYTGNVTAIAIALAAGLCIFIYRNSGIGGRKKITEGPIDMQWVVRSSIVAVLDIVVILAAYLAALLLRFDFLFSRIPEEYLAGYTMSMPFWIVATLVAFYGCRLYHSIWSFASISELERLVAAHGILMASYAAGVFVMGLSMPKSYFIMGFILAFCGCTANRFIYRFMRYWVRYKRKDSYVDADERIMVVGAGEASQTMIKGLLHSNKYKTNVCCVIDDNPSKKGRLIEGVQIVGNRNDILDKVKELNINKIIYAIPSADGKTKKEILNICKETGCRLQTVPGIHQIVNGEVNVSSLRDVEITDLLGRSEIEIKNDQVGAIVKDATVMVTGGGGSIGSELCRQIAANQPKQLIIFDIYENNAYEIQQELKRQYPDMDLQVLIGSVRDDQRIDCVMRQYKPQVVFHAAAHKHVPLMETSPGEAVKNNALGTYKTAKAASDAGVKTFVLISTDKAVNPTNIMGATKRICEMIVQMMNRSSQTRFVAVRFGNVLGSNGSVIPLFKQQIANGGPVTVTHPDIIRYFMTIPEAVSLVLQAACFAEGGEIFVLDMGEPVKIVDMAKNLIQLSGLTPDVDIKIEFTGLRPGEKLFEEMLMDEEGMTDTANALIHIGKPIEMDDIWFKSKLEELESIRENENTLVRNLVQEIVPTYSMQR